MDRSEKLILLLLFVALSVWRLIRYMKAGLAKRPESALPGFGGSVAGVPPSTTAPAPASPIDNPAKGSIVSRVVEKVSTALIFVAGNILIWGCLFGLPELDEWPTIWRLIIGVFANFPLIRLAHAIGKSAAKRASRQPPAEGNSPFR